jgi:hypothetical protein
VSRGYFREIGRERAKYGHNRDAGTAGRRVESLVAEVEGCGWFAARLDFLLRLDGGRVWSRSTAEGWIRI